MFDVVVSSVASIIDDQIRFAMQTFTAENWQYPVEAAVSNAIPAVIDEQVSGKIVSELIRDSASPEVKRPDVVLTVAHKIMSSEKLMTPVANFWQDRRRRGEKSQKRL